MKKHVRIVVFIATIILALTVLSGIIIQLISTKPLTDSVFEIIALFVSVTSVAIAIIAQVASYRDRKKFAQMIHELKTIDSEVDAEQNLDRSLRKKLDELIALDHKIYNRVSQKRQAKK